MGGIKKFRSFDEARETHLREFIVRGFDPERMERFFQEYAGTYRNPYSPGLYRFKSFEEARRFDYAQRIRAAVERKV